MLDLLTLELYMLDLQPLDLGRLDLRRLDLLTLDLKFEVVFESFKNLHTAKNVEIQKCGV